MKPYMTPSVITLIVWAAISALAQQTPAPSPTFDVVSIKRSAPDAPRLMRVSPGRIEMPSTTLKGLIGSAYARFVFDPREIVGGPSWIDSDRYTVIATAAAPFKTAPDGFPTDLTAMLRSLIEDRFKVKVHSEQREAVHYALVLARADGKTGAALRSAPDECSEEVKTLSGGRGSARRPGPPPCSFGGGPGKLIATGVSMTAFANNLSRSAGRLVVNRTGLTGGFDIELNFDPSSAAIQPPGAPPGPAPRDDTAPSLFTALQEQLGLKLESTRGPVDVLVVDSAERPTEN